MHALNKILIIRFSSLGDVILASPLIRVLRQAYPEARIDFAVKSEFSDVLRFNQNLSTILELGSPLREELRALAIRVRSIGYDLILDIHNSLRSRYLRLSARARAVNVVNKRILARLALVNLKRNFYRGTVSVPERYLETVKRYGVSDDGAGLEVEVPGETAEAVRAMLGKYELDRYPTVVGLVPMAKHFTKQWPSERFVEFGVQFARRNKSKIILFGPREGTDTCGDIAQMINAEVGSTAAVSLAGMLSILEVAAALDHCTLVVSNDSGLMHLAAARKRKVVAVFGSTVKEFGFFPYGTESIVLERNGLSCRPCSHIGLERCPKGHFRCMKEIQAADAVAAAEQLLRNPSVD